MSNDFILNSDIISVFEKNGVVLLKNMIDNKWQRILLDAIEEDIKKPGPKQGRDMKILYTHEANVENHISIGDHLLAKFIPPLINHTELKRHKIN